MKVKRYTGDTMQDAIFKVKADLGSEAVILNTRTIKTGGLLGFFGKKQTEIMAAAPKESKREEKNTNNRELMELKEMVAALMQRIPQGLNGKRSPNTLMERYAPPLRPLVSSFYEKGLKQDLIQDLMDDLSREWQASPTFDSLEGLLMKGFKNIFERVIMDREPGRIQAFVGPTGVGKTTTIAKLAANYVLQENRTVALLTTDTYRIAAVEQLKIYSEIIDVPLEVLYKPPELEPMIESLADYDYILIDTAGLSPLNKMGMSHLESFVKNEVIDTVYLVLAACTRDADLDETIRLFEDIGFHAFIFTKLDETESWGAVLNAIFATHRWVTYITTGQDVPEDIEALKLSSLIKNLAKGQDLYGSGSKIAGYSQ